ncbi:MAG: hypothetical protein H7Z42_14030 [Roseiflexaceae bacterium]|nr:hypothetical protein [Roseiflexaceae bacterium]
MSEYDPAISALAASGADMVRLARLLADTRSQLQHDALYIFQASGGIGSGGKRRTTRTLLAFETPDSALLFAQRNQLHDDSVSPRLRRLTLTQLLLAMVRDPGIGGLLIVRDGDEYVAGRMPEGLLVERASLF